MNTPDIAYCVAVAGDVTYIASGWSGLVVGGIPNPSAPLIVGSVDTQGTARAVAVAGAYVYVAAGGDGLQILPTQCELTPVFLAHSSVRATGDGVEILWRTSAEWNVAGFNVLRSDAGGQGFRTVNEELVPAAGRDHEYRVLDRSVWPGSTYVYRLEVVDLSGERQVFPLQEITVPMGVMRLATLPVARPNPFSARTTIRFEIDGGRSAVAVRVYDAGGRLIRNLLEADLDRGAHHVVWDGRDERGRSIGAGTYFYVLETQGRQLSARMTRVE
jgi:hypothetical protein